MPELPEVETVVRSLRPGLVGRKILNAEFRQLRILRGDPDVTSRELSGRVITAIERRGKFIVIRLNSGFLVVHLGMTGKLLIDAAPAKHTHAILQLDRGTLIYNDSRQFGRIEWGAQLPDRLEKLGPEPLEIEFDDFFSVLRQRTRQVKALLLDQSFLRGIGNIYADEALFRAGIHPLTLSSKLRRRRAERLYHAIREVLVEAIDRRGSSVSDYVDASGMPGSFQSLHRVYLRTGKPCVGCGKPIRRTLVAQRGTHFCPHCQKQ